MKREMENWNTEVNHGSDRVDITYLDRCPRCYSFDIYKFGPSWSDDIRQIESDIECNDCGCVWGAIYTLSLVDIGPNINRNYEIGEK